VIIAIDGPAAAGKSSTAQSVADALGFQHLESGALYRAVTAARLRQGGSPTRWLEADVLKAAQHVTYELIGGRFTPQIDGAQAENELRSAAVTAAVTRIAQMPAVRDWVNARLRDASAFENVVVDGRDMATTVFPDADLKVYLVADPWERARRRLIQRDPRAPSEDEILEETTRIIARDQQDAAQSVPSKDALQIDTTTISQQEQIAQIVAMAKRITKP
jgi:cytidylate kinase